MNGFDKGLLSARKELLIQLAFTIFTVMIPDQSLQMIVLGIGFLVVTLLISIKSAGSPNSYGLLGQLVKYVAVQGTCYFLILFAWIWGGELMNLGFDLSNGFLGGILIIVCLLLLVWFTIIATIRGATVLTIKIDYPYPIIELFWIVGLIISLNVSDGGYSGAISMSIILGIFVIFFSRVGAVLLVSNAVAGTVFGYLYISLGGHTYPSLEIVSFLSGIVAAIASAMIKGLTFLAIREE